VILQNDIIAVHYSGHMSVSFGSDLLQVRFVITENHCSAGARLCWHI